MTIELKSNSQTIKPSAKPENNGNFLLMTLISAIVFFPALAIGICQIIKQILFPIAKPKVEEKTEKVKEKPRDCDIEKLLRLKKIHDHKLKMRKLRDKENNKVLKKFNPLRPNSFIKSNNGFEIPIFPVYEKRPICHQVASLQHLIHAPHPLDHFLQTYDFEASNIHDKKCKEFILTYTEALYALLKGLSNYELFQEYKIALCRNYPKVPACLLTAGLDHISSRNEMLPSHRNTVIFQMLVEANAIAQCDPCSIVTCLESPFGMQANFYNRCMHLKSVYRELKHYYV
ncbi:hypothetical protein K502DRAFT_36516 [Neoconidiobolus thromboides FSU 785]|nr:hypothetical protein K502DRAFT_36516 [Neoconidiobolus thromboides FSU 785]